MHHKKLHVLAGSKLLATLLLLTPALHATTTSTAAFAAVPSYSAESEIAAALYAASATQEAALRVSDRQISELMRQIDSLRKASAELSLLNDRETNAATAARIELAKAQQRFVAELELRDRSYKYEIAVFRNAVQDIAAVPERLSALALYNAGDHNAALEILDQLDLAELKANQTAADIRKAQVIRNTAGLAREMVYSGSYPASKAIERYEKIISLDGSHYWDWVVLSGLYIKNDQLELAETAASKAVALVSVSDGNINFTTTLEQYGKVLQERGQFERAKAYYLQSLERRKDLESADNSLLWKNLIAQTLIQLGALHVEMGSVDEGEIFYRQAIAELNVLAVHWPSFKAELRMLVNTRIDIAGALGEEGKYDAAFDEYKAAVEALTLYDTEIGQDKLSLGAAWRLAIGAGDLTLDRNDVEVAIGIYAESLTIARLLVDEPPQEPADTKMLMVALHRLAQSHLHNDDPEKARPYLIEMNQIAEKMQMDGNLQESDKRILEEFQHLYGLP